MQSFSSSSEPMQRMIGCLQVFSGTSSGLLLCALTCHLATIKIARWPNGPRYIRFALCRWNHRTSFHVHHRPKHRTDRDQHDSHAGDGRRRSRQQRPSRHADGPRAGRVPVVDAAPAIRPRRAALAESRSLRPLLRPRLDVALLADPPGRHPRGHGRWQSHRQALAAAGGNSQLPPMGQPHAGPPRSQAHQRRRNHDRAARPGLRQQRRHGHRRRAGSPPATTNPASSCSTSTSGHNAATAT